MKSGFRILGFFVAMWFSPLGVSAADGAAPVRQTWTVDGVEREALVYRPPHIPAGGAPVVFVFHGHTGTMRHAARTFAVHELWPDAVVVYPQGLPTVSQLVDKEGKYSGWQGKPGDQGDRDLRFFDAMLETLSNEAVVDAKRVYVMGHSNGGLFTYVLWAARGEKIRAVAPSAALLPRDFRMLKPKPAFIMASPKDPLVKYAWQERMIDWVIRLNGCKPAEKPWRGKLTLAGAAGNDVVLYIHEGGHDYPHEATGEVVAFFKALKD